MHYGIFSREVDGVLWGFDEDLETVEHTLCQVLGKKVWDQRRRSLKPKESLPMRLVQMKESQWTILYFVDKYGSRAEKYINKISDTEISYAADATCLKLQLADSSGAYALQEFWIGERKSCLTPDPRFFRGTPWENLCQRVTIDQIDHRLKEFKFCYRSIEDGGRTPDGAILPFEQAEYYHKDVRAHRLLV